MSYVELPELPYAADALKPYLSEEEFEYHHGKHHQAYVTKTNEMIGGAGLSDKSMEDAMKISFKENYGLFNQIAQVWNHTFYWNSMAPNGGGRALPSELETKIESDLGGFDQFRDQFLKKGAGQFGSGWVWLVINQNGKLEVTNTPNAENPIIHGQTPLLTADVWEHAYYIDYRNARPKYLEAFVDNLINWEFVAENLNKNEEKLVA